MEKKVKLMLVFVVSAILFGSIGVYAGLSFNASQIQYKNTTLDHAMDELYSEVNADILQKLNLSSSKVQYYESYGIKENRSLNINLNPGKYLVFSSFATTGNGNSLSSSSGTTQSPKITSSSCTFLAGRKNEPVAESQIGSIFILEQNFNTIYVCDIEDAETITVSFSFVSETISMASSLISQVVKLD